MTPGARRPWRHAAIVATAVTVPVVGILAFALHSAFSGDPGGSKATGAAKPPSAIAEPAPPNATRFADDCNKVLAALPVALNELSPRRVTTQPPSPYVVAWGDPAVVLSCGTARPADLIPGSSVQLFNAGNLKGPFYEVTKGVGGQSLYTIIDRAPFITIQIPDTYQAGPILGALVPAVGEALPVAVCSTEASADVDKLCSRRP